jgi:hypothetical protein
MREHVMRRLRTRALAFLIATDVTARVRSISRRVRLSSRLPLRGFFAMVIECRTCWLRLTASGSVSARTSR